MAIETFDWEIRAGDQKTESFTFTLNGEVVDITSRTYRAQFRESRNEDPDSTPAAEADCQVANPNVHVTLTAVQTRALAELGRRFFWDLEETNAGVPVTVVEGTAVVGQDVTK